MKEFSDYSIKIKNYKCFGPKEQGFEKICPFNLIIGRNNSGKSALLDMIENITKEKPEFDPNVYNKNNRPEIIIGAPIPKDVAKSVIASEKITDKSHFTQELTGKRIYWVYQEKNQNIIHSIEKAVEENYSIEKLREPRPIKNKIVHKIPKHFYNKIARRISAERDIPPEQLEYLPPEIAQRNNEVVSVDGRGSIKLIGNFLSQDESVLKNSVVEVELLSALNEIFMLDTKFTRIVCHKLPNKNERRQELYLWEESKGSIELSQSGSGLKTIILVLINVILIPAYLEKELKDFIFAFEELENNLHPALFRRLLDYLYKKSEGEEGATFFITSHSNVAIDLFSKKKDSQIIHVTHNGNDSTCTTATTYKENTTILDDLDVRASDLLQSNGVIWVEGPTDRLYINKWIRLKTDGKLEEGLHYQCIYYGGSLLSQLSSEDPDMVDVDDFISILNINRNACVVTDSDIKEGDPNPTGKKYDTKKRVTEEVERIGGMSWITQGKEIENYLPVDAISALFAREDINQVGTNEHFPDYLDTIEEGAGKTFKGNKMKFAKNIIPHLDEDTCFKILDLDEKIEELCKHIRKWNRMED